VRATGRRVQLNQACVRRAGRIRRHRRPLRYRRSVWLLSHERRSQPTTNERRERRRQRRRPRRRPRRCGQRWRETVHALPSQRERQHQELPGRRQALPLRPLPPPPRHCTFKEDMWSKDENGKWGWIGRDICSIPRMPRNPARVARVHDPARPHTDRVSERPPLSTAVLASEKRYSIFLCVAATLTKSNLKSHLHSHSPKRTG
jgi:hypothetical protein